MPSPKSYHRKQNGTLAQSLERNKIKCKRNENAMEMATGMPLHRRVCECYLILKDFHTTSKFPPDAQKRTTHSLTASPFPPTHSAAIPLYVCVFYVKQNFCTLEYNSWNNIEEIHRRKQTHFTCTNPNNHSLSLSSSLSYLQLQ